MDNPEMNSETSNQIKYSFCSKCGENNSFEAAFCSVCGQNMRPKGVERSQNLTGSIPELEEQLALLQGGLGDEVSVSEKLTQTRFLLAVAYLRKEESAKAIIQLRAVTAHDPSNAIAHAYLGSALLEEYKVEEAQSELERALELNTQDAIIQLKMGEFKLKLGLLRPAEAHLEAAFKLPAPSPETANYIYALLQKVRKMNKKIVDRPNRLIVLKIPILTGWLRNKRTNKSRSGQSETLSVPETNLSGY